MSIPAVKLPEVEEGQTYTVRKSGKSIGVVSALLGTLCQTFTTLYIRHANSRSHIAPFPPSSMDGHRPVSLLRVVPGRAFAYLSATRAGSPVVADYILPHPRRMPEGRSHAPSKERG